MKIKLADIEGKLIGTKLVGMQFAGKYASPKDAEDAGDQWVPYGEKIKDAWVGVTEGDLDPCVWMTLENGMDVYAYANEEITVEPQP